LLDNELGKILAELSSTLLKNGMSEMVKSGSLDDILAPVVGMGNDLLGIIPSDSNKSTKSNGDGFGTSSSQIFSDLSSALSKVGRNF